MQLTVQQAEFIIPKCQIKALSVFEENLAHYSLATEVIKPEMPINYRGTIFFISNRVY